MEGQYFYWLSDIEHAEQALDADREADNDLPVGAVGWSRKRRNSCRPGLDPANRFSPSIPPGQDPAYKFYFEKKHSASNE